MWHKYILELILTHLDVTLDKTDSKQKKRKKAVDRKNRGKTESEGNKRIKAWKRQAYETLGNDFGATRCATASYFSSEYLS